MPDLQSLSNKELQQYKKQLEYEISKYRNIQLARKTNLNSAYGALGNEYFRYFDIHLASAVTLSGQLVIRWLEQSVNAFLNKLLKIENNDFVIAVDTDSLYITFQKLIDSVFPGEKQDDITKVIDALDKICKEVIEPEIKRSCEELYKYVNAAEDVIAMKREALANKGIWTSKKRYILNVYDNEGVRYSEPKLKIMGIEAVRSSTPNICREKIKECLKLIMNGTEENVIAFISDFRKQFMSCPPEDVAFPRTVNNLKKYSVTGGPVMNNKVVYQKGSPIHVKGAIIYNYWLKDKKLLSKYDLIKEGEKMKFVYLREPNYVGSPVIGFLDTLPKEFGICENVDYDVQFEKGFIEPIKVILDLIGWKTKHERNLSLFFD